MVENGAYVMDERWVGSWKVEGVGGDCSKWIIASGWGWFGRVNARNCCGTSLLCIYIIIIFFKEDDSKIENNINIV